MGLLRLVLDTYWPWIATSECECSLCAHMCVHVHVCVQETKRTGGASDEPIPGGLFASSRELTRSRPLLHFPLPHTFPLLPTLLCSCSWRLSRRYSRSTTPTSTCPALQGHQSLSVAKTKGLADLTPSFINKAQRCFLLEHFVRSASRTSWLQTLLLPLLGS